VGVAEAAVLEPPVDVTLRVEEERAIPMAVAFCVAVSTDAALSAENSG
jgi:hypothetical protein